MSGASETSTRFCVSQGRNEHFLNSRGQLVHDADIMARQQTGEDKFNEQDAEPPEEIPTPSPPSAETAAVARISPALWCGA